MKGAIIFLYFLSLITVTHAIAPRSRASTSLAFVKKDESRHNRQINLSSSLRFRGGAEESDSDFDEYDDEYDEDEEESEDEDEEETEVEEVEDDEEDEEEITPTSSLPVKVTLKTSLSDNALIDQSIEITASPTRTVQSLKQSVSRQFKSRPPIDAITLRLDGQVLDDETLVQDLVDEEDEEDEEEEEDDGDDDGLSKLCIIVDMVPPVDPKFGTEMKGRLDDMTNKQVLDAYIANLASVHQNSMDLIREDAVGVKNEEGQEDEDGDDDEEEDDDEKDSVTTSSQQTNLEMQRYALLLREQITKSLSQEELDLLEKTDTPSSPVEDNLDSYDGDLLLKESIKRRKRKGGATMNVKRALQKNLNINWPDTIRNFLLFLFFGYFGGRNAMSRTIMLLGAPACFIIQARPVKVAIKQLFYTIGEPPGILLSLLPAPQQAIMSCDYDTALKDVYGEEVANFNDIISGDQPEEDESDLYEGSSESDEEYDEYDEDY